MENLFDNEEIIKQTKNKTLILTNNRIRYTGSHKGKNQIISILLNNISAVELNYSKSNIGLLVAGIVIAFGSFLASITFGGEVIIIGLIISVIPIAIYFTQRMYSIIITSNGGTKIEYRADGFKGKETIEWIDAVEKSIINNR